MFKRLSLAAAFFVAVRLSASSDYVTDVNNHVQATINTIHEKLPYHDTTLEKLSQRNNFSEEELAKIVDTLCKNQYAHTLSKEEQEKLLALKSELINKLKSYTISGFSFCVDPNVAFIYDHQNPEFDVLFKNEAGEIKSCTYQGSITSWGLKTQLAIKLNMIFFVGTDINFYNARKTINLGYGIDLGIGIPTPGCYLKDGIGLPGDLFCYGFAQGLHENNPNNEFTRRVFNEYQETHAALQVNFMYVPFLNASGGMIMISLPICLSSGYHVSLVTGGTLTPCK